MLNKSLSIFSLISVIAALTACSSSSSHSHLESLTESPLVSKPLNMQGLQDKAKQDSEFVVKHAFDDNEFDIKNYNVTINGKTYQEGDTVDLKDLGANPGLAPTVTITDIKENFDAYSKKGGHKLGNIGATRKAYLYQQQYSIIGSIDPVEHTVDGKPFMAKSCTSSCDTPVFVGELTKQLPTEGSASYTGVAWTKTPDSNAPYALGSLNYTVNFADKKGAGKISLPQQTDITLEKADISKVVELTKNALDGSPMPGTGIFGAATQGDVKGQYDLAFFGKSADEIAGYVDMEGNTNIVDVAFSGVKDPK